MRVLTVPLVLGGRPSGTFWWRPRPPASNGPSTTCSRPSPGPAAWAWPLPWRWPSSPSAGRWAAQPHGGRDRRRRLPGASSDCLAAAVDAPADEVGRVADAFDNLLGRIDEAIASQRRFISDASHELRTPLTVAKGQLELIGPLDDPDADRSVRLALEELDRIGSTVEELLLLARLDEGLPLAAEPVEVELVLREAALRGMLLGQGEIVVDAPEGLSVAADPDRLLQVVSNLTGNALRHGGPGVTVTLAARSARPARW